MLRSILCAAFVTSFGAASFAQAADQATPLSGKFDYNGQRMERANNPEQPKTAFKTIPEWTKQLASAKTENSREDSARVIERIATANRKDADKLTETEISDCRAAAMELAKSKEVGPRISGLVALRTVGDADAKKAALQAAKHSNPDVKEAGVQLLMKYCDDSTIPIIAAYAISKNSMKALNAIAEQKLPSAKKALEDIAANGKKPELRDAATAALAKRGDK